jgi:hypothetical protein
VSLRVDDEVVQEALRKLASPDEHDRNQALLILGWQGDYQVIDTIITVLENDPLASVRANAAVSLGQLGSKKALKSLIKALNDKNETVRGMVAYSLGMLKEKESIPHLTENLLTEDSSDAKIAAAEALRDIGEIESLKALAQAIVREENDKVKNEIKKAYRDLASHLEYEKSDSLIEKEQLILEERQEDIINEEQHEQNEPEHEEDKDYYILEADSDEGAINKLLEEKMAEVQEEDILELVEELPNLFEYAIDQEKISINFLTEYFSCDIYTIIEAIARLNNQEIIKAEIEKTTSSVIIHKPNQKLSKKAKSKIKLLRKKKGFDW